MKTIIIDGYNLLFAAKSGSIKSDDKYQGESDSKNKYSLASVRWSGRDKSSRIEKERQELIERLKSFQAGRGLELLVVFDGAARMSQRPSPHFRVVFTSDEQDADTFIVEWVRNSTVQKDILVVSSDRDIKNRLRTTSAKVISAGEFYQRLIPESPEENQSGIEAPEKIAGIPPGEVAGWLKIFGLDKDD